MWYRWARQHSTAAAIIAGIIDACILILALFGFGMLADNWEFFRQLGDK